MGYSRNLICFSRMVKMTDDWSLKNKRNKIYSLSTEPQFYQSSDIEILRKKLIEDMEELDEQTHDREYNWKDDVIRIINRRFGVE